MKEGLKASVGLLHFVVLNSVLFFLFLGVLEFLLTCFIPEKFCLEFFLGEM